MEAATAVIAFWKRTIWKRKGLVFLSQSKVVYVGTLGGKKLNKKCLSIFAKNFFNQSSYVYEFPDGSNEHSPCSICFKAILRKIEQNIH